MRGRRAAASALSGTNGSMPSTLHDTREFMLASGFDLGAPPAPSASPRVPEKRQSNSAQVVCLWHRLFRVTVNNRLRNRTVDPESCGPGELNGFRWAATANRSGQVVAMAGLIPALGFRNRLRSTLELSDCCAAESPLNEAASQPRGNHAHLQSPPGRRQLPAQRRVSNRPL